MRGLPQFQFMGLPDVAIRESQLRIRSAIKQQGFAIPKGQQVLVNLKPAYVKKSSRGLELAVAAAFLWMTGQLPKPTEGSGEVFVYGVLGLDGSVSLPDDLDSLMEHDHDIPIWSGVPEGKVGYSINAVKELKELSRPELIIGEEFDLPMERPELARHRFSKSAARLIELVAAGEHSVLLAGPAGSGKTTLASAIHQSLIDPPYEDFLMSQRIGKLVGQPPKWRPYVSPHHTVPVLSMIGGGVPPFPGEITRAHGGTLVLDEFLEFPSKVREALREPIERGEIVVARRGRPQTYPAQFLLIATTNLCVCGELVPGKSMGCRYSLTRCRAYSERLSGPILDRFQILSFSHKWNEPDDISVEEIMARVGRARNFALQSRKQSKPNSRISDEEVMRSVDIEHFRELFPVLSTSRRRLRAILRVARSLADLDSSKKVEVKHLEEALSYGWRPFEAIQRIFT